MKIDGLNRLTNFSRGVLSASTTGGPLDTIASPGHTRSWSLDSAGNWTDLHSDGVQTEYRDHNEQNQIIDINGGDNFIYDGNGNLKEGNTGSGTVGGGYDAWNRLGGAGDHTYSYDALGRRITDAPSSGSATELYYSKDWQVLEERVSGHATKQYVWGTDYVDHLLERDRDSDNDSSHTLDERLFVIQDANWDVTALVSATSGVVERYMYDPYGSVTVMNGNWTPKSGNASTKDWVYLHQGGRLDTNTGLYSFRHRDYSAELGRWMEEDPAGYVDGMNLYQLEGSSPAVYTDPIGTDSASVQSQHVSSDQHDNYQVFYLQCPCNQSVTGASVDYGNMYFDLAIAFWLSAGWDLPHFDTNVMDPLNHDFGATKGQDPSNCNGKQVEVDVYMRTRLVAGGMRGGGYRWWYNYPPPATVLALYAKDTHVNYSCTPCTP